MVHGAIQDFDDIFLTAGAEEINDKTSAPFYLAANNVDVWGIDLGWTRVPMETTDFSFMKDWGVEKDIDHTLKAMSIARIIRGLSGQSFSRLNLLGFSYGVQVAFGAADRETQQHKICRDVKGLIPVDSPLKNENVEVQNAECVQAAYWMDKLNSGEYNHPWGVGLIQLGGMALADPDAPSPVPDFAGLTNIQVMNAIGSDHSAGWHFFGGNPFELYYSDPMRFVRLAVELSPHMPAQMFYEMSACGCPSEDVGYDDNLMAIDIPILNLSAGGSAGESMSYTSEQFTSSADITNIVISLVDDPTQDFGHADLWMAYEADILVWNKLYIWLINHQH